MKMTCTKYAAWHEKKGTLINFVCLEINLVIVPIETWWIDTRATTHISITMQGCLRNRMPTDGEKYIYVGNDNKVAVNVIGIFILQLDSSCTLDLDETFVVPLFRRNLIFVSCLDKIWIFLFIWKWNG